MPVHAPVVSIKNAPDITEWLISSVYAKLFQDKTAALEFYYSFGIGYENPFSKVLLLGLMRPHIHLLSNYLSGAFYRLGLEETVVNKIQ